MLEESHTLVQSCFVMHSMHDNDWSQSNVTGGTAASMSLTKAVNAVCPAVMVNLILTKT